MVKLRIKGVIVPLLTPFDQQGEVDLAAAKRLVEFLIQRGVHGLFPGGTTGEGPLLSTQERRQLTEAVVQAADGQVPVIVHTGAITTAETLELTRHAQAAGAQAAAIVAPYYYPYHEQALFLHFEHIATQVPDLPMYLYHNPFVGRSHLSVELITRLVECCPNIIGIKDSSGSLETLKVCVALRGGNFNTANGDDGLILAAMATGFDACVSGNSNVVPELVVALYHAASGGNLPRARELQNKLDGVRFLLRNGSDLSLFKDILGRRGLSVGSVRRPMLQAPESQVHECWRALTALDPNLVTEV
jgi:4-hydroxy-tetrahydrodipicolinate synthase